MVDRFLTFINTQELVRVGDRIVLAVSGGMDSVVMAELFNLAKLDFAIAHCNFSLRGEESDADELFVKKLAKKYKVPFYSEVFDTQAFADREHVSIQMAARVLRYQWFDQLLSQEGYASLATAHHQNDVLETVLLNLIKGTGIAGLHGIRARNGQIIRPMLFADKESIQDFVVDKQLTWREDSSNESNKYQRNLLRNEVVPLLKQINPNLEQTIHQTVERVQAVERIFDKETENLRQNVSRTEDSIVYFTYGGIQATSEPLMFLSELLKPYHFTYVQMPDILDAFNKEPGRTFHSPTHTLVKDRTELVITPRSTSTFRSASIAEGQNTFEGEDLRLILTEKAIEGFKISTNRALACLDAGIVQFPLRLRKWKQGDWFCPLGMNQKKRISDFLTDEKVPLNLKEQTYVLTSNGSIVWVVGHRVDNRFKVTDKTQKVLLIEKVKK